MYLMDGVGEKTDFASFIVVVAFLFLSVNIN